MRFRRKQATMARVRRVDDNPTTMPTTTPIVIAELDDVPFTGGVGVENECIREREGTPLEGMRGRSTVRSEAAWCSD